MNENILKKAINKIILSKYPSIKEIHKIQYFQWGTNHYIDVYFYVNNDFNFDDAILQEKVETSLRKLFKDMGFDGEIFSSFALTGNDDFSFNHTVGYKRI